MLKHVLIETLDNEYNFFNVQEFYFDKDTQSYVVLTQNDNLHSFSRENVKQIVI